MVKRFFEMALVKLKIDVSGTVGDEAWRKLRQFDEIQSADFGPQFGSGGRCNHSLNAPHGKGEWIGAEIRLQTPLLAQYAVSHYLEQDRVVQSFCSKSLNSRPPPESAQLTSVVRRCKSPRVQLTILPVPAMLH